MKNIIIKIFFSHPVDYDYLANEDERMEFLVGVYNLNNKAISFVKYILLLQFFGSIYFIVSQTQRPSFLIYVGLCVAISLLILIIGGVFIEKTLFDRSMDIPNNN